MVTIREGQRKPKVSSKSCWGCALDYLRVNGGTWTSNDVGKFEHPEHGEIALCPDCYEEAFEGVAE